MPGKNQNSIARKPLKSQKPTASQVRSKLRQAFIGHATPEKLWLIAEAIYRMAIDDSNIAAARVYLDRVLGAVSADSDEPGNVVVTFQRPIVQNDKSDDI